MRTGLVHFEYDNKLEISNTGIASFQGLFWLQFMIAYSINTEGYHLLQNCNSKTLLASSQACAKNGGAPGTHCLRMRLISPKCGDPRLFSHRINNFIFTYTNELEYEN